MEQGLINITSATTTTLIGLNTGSSGARKILLTNTHASTAVGIKLFLEDAAGNKAYVASTSIPGDTGLVLTDGLSLNNKISELKLTTTAGGLSTSTPLSVIIK